MPTSFQRRATDAEWMDDHAITDAQLDGALDQLLWVNRLLGGYSATMGVLAPYLLRHAHRPLRVLDLGTGAADFPAYLIQWARARSLDLHIVAVDDHPGVVRYAEAFLDDRLAVPHRSRIDVVEANALDLETCPALEEHLASGPFDVVVAALFVHHLADDEVIRLFRVMQRVARGMVVNDLHRHPMAYHSIRALSRCLPHAPMFQHDAPLSVLRGFKRRELVAWAQEAGLTAFSLRWCWAFRWVLTTLPAPLDESAHD
ncbi:MAG: methyltransferase domain-containing protein [Bacteroidota bacterium]